MDRKYVVRLLGVIGMVGVIIGVIIGGISAQIGAAQTTNSRHFPETGKTVRGLFWQYWQRNGGLPQQGYPISEEFIEVSDLNGKPYTVQYFERAVFEYHPENQPPYNVLLSQLGTFQYRAKYPRGAPNQRANTSRGAVTFRETGFTVGGGFLEYWQKNGGLAQQGYPISNEFVEVSDLNGKPYTVQYFERAVFEYHPENAPPYNVLLSQLGTFQFRKKYGTGGQIPGPQPTSSTQPIPSPQKTGVPAPVPTVRANSTK